MKLLHDLPISQKVMLVTMLTTGLALLLACTALLSYETREYRKKLEQDLATVGRIIGANSAAALSFDDSRAATEMLAALRAEPQIIGARIYRDRGEPLAEYIRPGTTMELPSAPGGVAFRVAEDRLHHFAPILDEREGQQTGTIYIAADFSGVRGRMKSYAGLLVVVLAAATFVALALSAKLQSYISGPILKLAETTRKVSDEGNYSLRAARDTKDEIGDLITSFNDMLAQIQQRDAELHAAHDTLERRVQERTAELLQEVSVRARAEEDLARSLSLVTATLDSTADGILVVDSQGAVVNFNQKFAAMWSIPMELLARGKDAELLQFMERQLKEPAAYIEKVNALYSDLAAASHDAVEFLDGRVFERYSQPHQVHGNTVGRVWSFRDVTERNKAEERIREQASLLDLAQDAIVVRDIQDVVLFWNKGAERVYGWKSAEVVGSQMGKLFYKDTARFLEANAAVIEENEWSGELSRRTKSGGEVLAESRWTLLRDGQGKPKSILVIETDVTERKQLEARFLRAQRMESIGTLAGGIAHDLNNVFAPIVLSIDLLRTEFSNSDADQVLDAIQLSAGRGADLVRQILYFARGADGQRVAVEPHRAVSEIFKIARDTFPKNIALDCAVAPDLWAIWGDPTQFHQVLLNLVVNARDAMPHGGQLTIAAENCASQPFADGGAALGPAVLVRVTDTGVGIEDSVRERIFEPFFTTKEFGQGTGLGLSTVLAIVKSHGGSIDIQSEMGKGTTFTVAFPALVSPAEQRAKEEKPSFGHEELLLLVDDEPSVRLVVKRMLEASGYRVITAPDGATALSLYRERRGEIALVLTDMMMPGMDGPATIRALKKIDPDVPIIAASGMMHDQRERTASDAGAHAFLWKPYTADTVLRAISKVLLHKRESHSRNGNAAEPHPALL